MENSGVPLNGLPVRELLKGFERIHEKFLLRSPLTRIRCSLSFALRYTSFRCKLFCLEMPVQMYFLARHRITAFTLSLAQQ